MALVAKSRLMAKFKFSLEAMTGVKLEKLLISEIPSIRYAKNDVTLMARETYLSGVGSGLLFF